MPSFSISHVQLQYYSSINFYSFIQLALYPSFKHYTKAVSRTGTHCTVYKLTIIRILISKQPSPCNSFADVPQAGFHIRLRQPTLILYNMYIQ